MEWHAQRRYGGKLFALLAADSRVQSPSSALCSRLNRLSTSVTLTTISPETCWTSKRPPIDAISPPISRPRDAFSLVILTTSRYGVASGLLSFSSSSRKSASSSKGKIGITSYSRTSVTLLDIYTHSFQSIHFRSFRASLPSHNAVLIRQVVPCGIGRGFGSHRAEPD
jgi:hypothetical protein